MNAFKKKALVSALVAGFGMAAGAAQAVYLNPSGLGSTLLFPYYTVQSANGSTYTFTLSENLGRDRPRQRNRGTRSAPLYALGAAQPPAVAGVERQARESLVRGRPGGAAHSRAPLGAGHPQAGAAGSAGGVPGRVGHRGGRGHIGNRNVRQFRRAADFDGALAGREKAGEVLRRRRLCGHQQRRKHNQNGGESAQSERNHATIFGATVRLNPTFPILPAKSKIPLLPVQRHAATPTRPRYPVCLPRSDRPARR